jgi:uncharacterized protein involved in exopolysaccharide biosynthesis
MKPTQKVLEEVYAERVRQHAKWGEQNLPDVSSEYGLTCTSPKRAEDIARRMGVASAREAQQQCNFHMRRKTVAFADIALEEFAESIEAAALGEEANLRKELLQTAAVLVQWIECIDRRKGDKTLHE